MLVNHSLLESYSKPQSRRLAELLQMKQFNYSFSIE
jgi:hypothetical protein